MLEKRGINGILLNIIKTTLHERNFTLFSKSVLISCAAFLLCALFHGCAAPSTPEPVKAAAVTENVRLLIPEKIYAVPGVETNVYFNNVVTVINPANYVFDVECVKGRNDLKRWRYTPEKGDTGTYKWSIDVIGMNGVVAHAESELIVLPPDACAGKKINMFFVGASQTSAGHYPDRIVELMKRPGNPEFKTIGTRGRNGKHEGYGGWHWKSFLTRWGYTNSKKMDGMHPDRPVGFNSPFLFEGKDGKVVFDLQKYLDKHNNGQVPDAVSFQLGLNDLFRARDNTIAQLTEKSLQNMELLIAEFRKLKPAPEILIFQHIPGANQDAFGANYASRLTSWQYRKNIDYYNRALLKKAKELKIHAVPIYMNIDTENNMKYLKQPVNADNPEMIMRANNGVHPAKAGYYQMGDTLYCWIKGVMYNKK